MNPSRPLPETGTGKPRPPQVAPDVSDRELLLLR